MKRNLGLLVCFILIIAGLSGMSGCKDTDDGAPPSGSPVVGATPTMGASPAAVKPTMIGTLTASPNPIQVCDGSGSGKTTLSWSINQPVARFQIHIGSPTAPAVMVDSVQPTGKAETGKWVSDGSTFYLQDVARNQTVASVTVKVTKDGCPK